MRLDPPQPVLQFTFFDNEDGDWLMVLDGFCSNILKTWGIMGYIGVLRVPVLTDKYNCVVVHHLLMVSTFEPKPLMFSFLRKFDELKNLSEREQNQQPGENSKFKWEDADGTSEEVNIPVSGDNKSITVDISGNTNLPPNNVKFITITYGGSGVARNLPNPPG